MTTGERNVRLGLLVCKDCDGTSTVDFEGTYAICPQCMSTNPAPPESIPYPTGRCQYCAAPLEDHGLIKGCSRRFW